MRPKILVLTRYFHPAFEAGGPIQSLSAGFAALCEVLDFRVITGARDLTGASVFADVERDRWTEVGGVQVQYLSEGSSWSRAVVRLLRGTPHDAVYLNSAFDPTFTIVPLVARALGLIPDVPVLLAPRGEFYPHALALKAWKKRPYLAFARAIGLYRGVHWQAADEVEADQIEQLFGVGVGASAADGGRVLIAPNIVPDLVSPEGDAPHRASADGRRTLSIAFLSRIVPKKNLVHALGVLAEVSAPVELTVYGPIEDTDYWARCSRLISALPPNVKVEYGGIIPHERVVDTLSAHDLFLLPTFGESFGHVIREALVAGLPVLISDQTPWQHVAKVGAGWAFDLADRAAFVAAIERVAAWSDDERAAAREAARGCGERGVDEGTALDRQLRVFEQLTGKELKERAR